MVGPSMIQIGTEGGFLPAPVVLPNIPIGYDLDKRSITVLNVKEHNLFLGPAERADVIIDFSQVPDGSKIILYNDSPAPVPAGDPRLDYYTGDLDQTAIGGAPTTLPGYGPNTRTIMQFQVSSPTADPAFNLAALQSALPAAFVASQPAPLVPQAAYGPAYGKTLPNVYSKIQDTSLTYTPIGATAPITMPMKPKAIQELFELDYGRMNSILGVELPFTNSNTQTTVPLGYIAPATEIIKDGETQIWKVTHNGVDTHAIHFHLFNVQLINRVDWAGVVKPPEPNELGWKDTVRMNPLEDAIVALRPISQKNVPFAVPDSIRPLDPTMPLGTTFSSFDPLTGGPITVVNQMTNFGNEYVWHCHLLGHEEMDMMRPVIFQTVPPEPMAVTAVAGNAQATVSFNPPIGTGGSPITGYTVTSNPGSIIALGASSPIVVSGLTNGTAYTFTVTATNAVGTGLPSIPSNTVIPTQPPIIVDNADPVPAIAIVGTWTTATTNAGYWATNYRTDNNTGKGTKTFTFKPNLPTAGQYKVEMWYPARANQATAVPVDVSSTTGISTVNVNERLNGSQWFPIGTYTFAAGQTGFVRIRTTGTTNGIVVADAFRFTFVPVVVTVPGAPTAASAVAGNAQATVSFTAPASNGGSVITGYTATSNPGGIVGVGTTNAAPIVVTGLTNGTAYTFTVTATNAIGTSAASAPTNSVTPLAPATVPGAPTAASAVAGNAQATVSFTAPASNGGSVITGYTATSNPGGIVGVGTTNAAPIVVTGLTNGTAYTFTVTATNAIGTSAASAATNSVTPSAAILAAPTSFAGSASLFGTIMAQVLLSWQETGTPLTGFSIQRATDSAFTQNVTKYVVASTARSYLNLGLSRGTTYYYRIQATNTVSTSAWVTLNVTTP
ncbi:MAG: fibronectin type III domain-containing protein [Candidatus Omnitrophica bacterium]|nr:fibronectin type III domain-containing protein [Candidatus Omnitrophota bacterium]